MTNYNESLDTILAEHREWMRGIRTDRLVGTSSEATKQALTSLIKELVAEQIVQALKELKEEVIGEDIDEDNYGWKNWKGTTAKAINIILEEQRKAIDKKIKALEEV